MKNLAVLFAGDSKGLNGAAMYVNRFKRFEELFRNNGINPIICDYNKISSGADDKESSLIEMKYAQSRMHKIKNKIKHILSKTYLGNCLYIYFAWQRYGKKSIDWNHDKLKHADIILANDMYSAYYVIKDKFDKDIYFVMHNSGDLLKMLLDRLGKIKCTRKEKELHQMECLIFESSKKILFVSRIARDTFIRMFPQYEHKACYVPEGIEDIDNHAQLDFSSLKLICVGTVCDRKNQLALVQAMEKIHDSSVRLKIVGNGAFLDICKDYVHSHNLNNIEFTGAINNSDVPLMLEKSNVFILASKDEGLPAVGIEALRSGLPILVTDVGGCAELVNENGKVLSGTDVDGIADGIRYMITNKNKLPKMSVNSRRHYELEYSIDAMVNAYKELITGYSDS